MVLDINRMLCFSLKGKFAHFRKFYTNSSSLSYLIPPRTVLAGMIASVLKIPRDQYYQELGPESIGLSVGIPQKQPLTRQMQSMNYLHNKYFNLIAKGNGEVLHSQCKLELITGCNGSPVEYNVYVGFHTDNKVMTYFESKLSSNNWGYGIYLGQRQFRGYIENLKTFSTGDFEHHEASEMLDSICDQKNILELNPDVDTDIQKERMAFGFKQQSSGREMAGTQSVIFEKNGKSLSGLFKNIIKINNRFISFY